jgi:hypothetical protein
VGLVRYYYQPTPNDQLPLVALYAWNPLTTIPRRTTLEKQLAADALTPDTLKARQLLGLGRRESK